MAYQLKTTGIATKLMMCIAVDPDTDEIVDFASSAVTADMTVDAGISIGSQAWDGITRKYFQLATSNHVGFGTNKPSLGTVLTGDQRTVVWIGEMAGSSMVFGTDSSSYFGAVNVAGGGSTFPTIRATGYSSGTLAPPSAGSKRIFGFSFERGSSGFFTAYSAADTDGGMTVESAAANPGSISWTLSYVGRRNDSAAQQQNDKIHAVLIFNDDLTEAEWDSLRDDWFGTLLEDGVGPSELSGTATLGDITASGTLATQPDSSLSGSATLGDITAAGDLGVAPGVISTPVLKNNTGTVLASVSGIVANIYNVSTGALVVRKTGLSSNASGIVTISDALLVPGISYVYEIDLSAAGMGRRLPLGTAA